MDGILIVDKPRGMTSHDVVDFVRRRFGVKRVGHAGTLDPLATGLLVVLLGKMTKTFADFVNDDKEYVAEMVLGAVSDTGDSEGALSASSGKLDFARGDIEMVFNSFIGEISQLPALYSAVKYKGKKLYEYARKGLEVERQPRRVKIKSLDIIEFDPPKVIFRVACSKGTYIRQLCVDMGEALGCGAYLSGLKRTRSGRFSLEGASGIGELRSMSRFDLEKRLLRLG